MSNTCTLFKPGNEQDDPDDGVKDLVEVALKKLVIIVESTFN